MSGNRIEIKKKLDAIRAWNNGDMGNYYESEAKKTYADVVRLTREHKIDFIGIESPFVTATTRVPNIQKMSALYAKLAKEAYGSHYVKDNLEKDLLGMVGANWYFAATPQSAHRAEGVESSLIEYRFGKNYVTLSEALNKLFDSKTPENKKSIEEIIGSLANTSSNNTAILALARSKLAPDLFSEVERAAKARKEFDDDYQLREDWMLSSMKSRTDKTGLLIVGKNHIESMKAKAEYFCKAKKPAHSVPESSSPATR